MGDPPRGRRVQGGDIGGRIPVTVRDSVGVITAKGASGSGGDVGADGNGVA